MRIIHLAKRYYTNQDTLAEGFGRVYQFPKHWNSAGHDTSSILLDYRSTKSRIANLDGLEVVSLSAFDPRSWARLHSMTRRINPDIIVASGDCIIGVIGLHFARYHSANFVLDAYDDYSTFGSNRLFLGWNVFDYLRNQASSVLYASSALAKKHSFTSRHHIAANGIDPAIFRPIPIVEAKEKIGVEIKQTTLIGYFGGMAPDRGIDDLIKAVGILHASDKRIRLLLCGITRPDMHPLPNWVEYHGVVPHSKIVNYINACDVVALPYRRSEMMDLGSSCKIAEYMFCKRPICATATPNLTENFPKQAEKLRTCLALPHNAKSIVESLRKQLSAPIIVELPTGMTWKEIAGKTLEHFVEILNARDTARQL